MVSSCHSRISLFPILLCFPYSLAFIFFPNHSYHLSLLPTLHRTLPYSYPSSHFTHLLFPLPYTLPTVNPILISAPNLFSPLRPIPPLIQDWLYMLPCSWGYGLSGVTSTIHLIYFTISCPHHWLFKRWNILWVIWRCGQIFCSFFDKL